MCFPFIPCYFAIIHIKYHIKMSPLAPHTFLGMLPISLYNTQTCCQNSISIVSQKQRDQIPSTRYHKGGSRYFCKSLAVSHYLYQPFSMEGCCSHKMATMACFGQRSFSSWIGPIPPMNCADPRIIMFVITYTNSAQFIGASNDLIAFGFG